MGMSQTPYPHESSSGIVVVSPQTIPVLAIVADAIHQNHGSPDTESACWLCRSDARRVVDALHGFGVEVRFFPESTMV